MKRILFLLIVIASVAKQSPAQTSVYHPFPDSNAVWLEGYSSLDANFVQHNFSGQYFMNGDTIVNSITYHKIYYTGIETTWPPPVDTTHYYNVFETAIRNDSSKRVLEMGEYVLYDFNLNIGDTLHFNVGFNDVVTGIDSVLVGSDYRKRFLLYNLGPFPGGGLFIIEGVGASTGLLNQIEPFFESGGLLRCFYQNGNVLWHDSLVTNCNLYNSVQPLIRDNTLQISLYPNPAGREFTIRSSQSAIKKIEIFDVMGENVYSNQTINHSSCIVNCALPPGVYFVKIIEGETVVTKKLIIE